MNVRELRNAVAPYIPAWTMRLTFAAAFFVLGEVMLWDHPNPAEWPRRAIGCAALAALALDMIVRFNVRDTPGLMLAVGVFGVAYGALVIQPPGNDLLKVIVLRPLGWFSLVGGGIGLALARALWRGASFSTLRAVAAGGLGLLWGAWVHWFQTQPPESENVGEPVPLATALAVAAVGLAVIGALAASGAGGRWVDRLYDEDKLKLVRTEWAVVGAVMATFFGAGLTSGELTTLALSAMTALEGFMIGVLYFMRTRYRRSALREAIPPQPLNLPHYTALALIFLLAAAVGHSLPAMGDAAQPDQIKALINVLFILGALWLPAVGITMAVRAFSDLAREGF